MDVHAGERRQRPRPGGRRRAAKVFDLQDGGVKFVEGHGINDAEHAADLEEKIANHVTRPEDAEAVEQVAETVVDLYVRMLREIGGEEPTWA